MTVAIRAIYEGGNLRLLEPLELPEHTVVRIAVETGPGDAERREWLDQGQRSLLAVWDNECDDVYNALLTR
jgi:predicted DNA-binding antitoxin AbrB/MazE fold protein